MNLHAPVATRQQLDLLIATFLRHSDALDAWERWRNSVDWNHHLDQPAFSLLPILRRNLLLLGGRDSLMERFQGIRRQAWLANQLWIRQIQETLSLCNKNSIELLFLPPTRRLLRDSSAVMKRMEAINVAVRPHQAERAIRLLLCKGWLCPEVRLPNTALTGFTVGRQHLELHHDNGLSVRLNWGLKWLFPGGAEPVWGRAIRADLGGHTAFGLDATDTMEFELRKPLQEQAFGQMADLLLAASESQLDWQRLETAFHNHPMNSDWLAILSLLQPILDQWDAPGDLAHWCHTDDDTAIPRRTSFLARGREGWKYYRTQLGKQNTLSEALRQLPGYLVGRWNLDSTSKIPFGLLRWVIRG